MSLLPERAAPTGPPVVAIVGSPNVGKSVMFNNLTGRYVTVSNYPGTTVEVSRGSARIEARELAVVDTPGMYSLVPVTDEERVARRILFAGPEVVLYMVDAKSIERMLPLSLQLGELGLNVVLVLNMMDEAKDLGIHIDTEALAATLGVPVVETVATTGDGLGKLRRAIVAQTEQSSAPPALLPYPPPIEKALGQIIELLPQRLASAARGIALLLLQEDSEIAGSLQAEDPVKAAAIASVVATTARASERPLPYEIALARHAHARAVVRRHLSLAKRGRPQLARRLSDLTVSPLTGIPILAAIIYFGLYKFVGVFGAGDVVDLLANDLFGGVVNPWLNSVLGRWLPGDSGWTYWTRELVGGDYGLVTLGVTYAIAIVLPIVSLFFLFFSVLEDSGYFPRLALLVDRVFKKIGLNGRAVIPLVLGLGCGTMATMVTRIQETRRERIITSLLLALVIPCSAQYGVITALLANEPAGALGVSYAWLAWAGILGVLFAVTGRLASRFVPGTAASFYMELPPLRLPRLGNVLAKTLARMKWYFLEVLPLFLLASLLIWAGRLTHLFDLVIAGLRPVVALIGLPPETAAAFLYGFFRRDFGAAGLFDLADRGLLSGVQLLVASVTLTLFLPCVAQFLILKKERGLGMAITMSAGVVTTAFLVGGAVNLVATATGVTP